MTMQDLAVFGLAYFVWARLLTFSIDALWMICVRFRPFHDAMLQAWSALP